MFEVLKLRLPDKGSVSGKVVLVIMFHFFIIKIHVNPLCDETNRILSFWSISQSSLTKVKYNSRIERVKTNLKTREQGRVRGPGRGRQEDVRDEAVQGAPGVELWTVRSGDLQT